MPRRTPWLLTSLTVLFCRSPSSPITVVVRTRTVRHRFSWISYPVQGGRNLRLYLAVDVPGIRSGRHGVRSNSHRCACFIRAVLSPPLPWRSSGFVLSSSRLLLCNAEFRPRFALSSFHARCYADRAALRSPIIRRASPPPRRPQAFPYLPRPSSASCRAQIHFYCCTACRCGLAPRLLASRLHCRLHHPWPATLRLAILFWQDLLRRATDYACRSPTDQLSLSLAYC